MTNSLPVTKNGRVLIIDDHRPIHDDFARILSPLSAAPAGFDASETALFGTHSDAIQQTHFELSSAYQGQEGLRLVTEALAGGKPFAMAFVDVRMPPGWDGVETIRRTWEIDPDTQIVICTAYSDYSCSEIFAKLDQRDGWLILKKPFDGVEAFQLAQTLTEKRWLHQQSRRKVEELESRVAERTAELATTNAALQTENSGRKRTEEQLRVQTTALDAAANAVVITDHRGTIQSINPAFTSLTGYTAEEAIGQNPRILKGGSQDKEFYRNLWQTISSGQAWGGELTNRRKDGSVYSEEMTITPLRGADGAITRYIGIKQDITERKRAEEKRSASQHFIEGIINAMPVRVFWKDKNLVYLGCNMVFARGAGFADPKDIIGKDDYQIGWPDQAELSRASDREVIESGNSKLDVEEQTTPDGNILTLLTSRVPLRDSKGEISGVIGTHLDITERKQSEEHLGEQADIINRAHDAIIVLNFKDQRIASWNSGAERLYGWVAEDAIGKPLGELIFAEAKESEKPLRQLLASAGEFRGEIKQVASDGRKIVVNSRATLIRNPDGTPLSVLFINTDVTEQKDLETQLLRAQRLESIGTLASGVAHDLNNILTPILTSAAILKADPLQKDLPTLASMDEESALRGASVVKQVLSFARGIEGKRVVIKASHLVDEMVDIARTAFPKSIEFTSRCPDDLWSVTCDPTQLRQVLLTLSVNARDAMPNGGSITIGAENFEVDERYASVTPGAKPGPHITFRVTDTGNGMSRATMDKIYDPFFTTKDISKGTGLGLSTVLGIVKGHGGFISVSSEVGQGTTFKVSLPGEVNVQSTLVPVGCAAPAKGNGELVLLVDDEENIIQATKAVLERNNYRVLSASDGVEALARFARQMQEINVVLTDIAMPYIDGVASVRAIRKMKPMSRSSLSPEKPGKRGSKSFRPLRSTISCSSLSARKACSRLSIPRSAQPARWTRTEVHVTSSKRSRQTAHE